MVINHAYFHHVSKSWDDPPSQGICFPKERGGPKPKLRPSRPEPRKFPGKDPQARRLCGGASLKDGEDEM